MTTYVAFLRAINLGPTRKVSMARLRAVLEGLGYDDVRTYLNSGNVSFDATGGAATLEKAVERALADELGFEVETFVRTLAQLRKVATHEEPLADDEVLHVTFLRKGERFYVRRRGEQPQAPRKAELRAATDRNVATVRKIVAALA